MCSISHGMRLCECHWRGSALNQAVRGQPHVNLSRLSFCISSLAWFTAFLCEFPLYYSSVCLVVQRPSWYIDVTTAFPQVPVRNFTARVIAQIPRYLLPP